MGAHIERLLGTLLRALHELPGATFSNPGERGNYDSQARAVMTLAELERWLTEYIVGVYHAKPHRGIGTSPLHRWTTGVFGDAHDGGAGVIDRPANEERIRLDFLPFVERTVQAYGISIDGIHYYSDVLRRFVGATENGRRRVFVFRRDPRDISTVSFWDPELQRYSMIRTATRHTRRSAFGSCANCVASCMRRGVRTSTRRRFSRRIAGCVSAKRVR